MKSKFARDLIITKPTDFFKLSNDVEIPLIGFGTWQVKNGEDAYKSVLTALKSGYRHIDTAYIYGNEESVGRAIKDSKIARNEIFVTTKLWNTAHSYDLAKQAINDSLTRLGLDYIDLYLIHWPNPVQLHENDRWIEGNKQAYRAMEEAYREGKIRALGLSNFRPHHIEALLKDASIKPHVNQIYFNPSDTQDDVVATNDKYDILTEAYSPFGTGKIFEVSELKHIAERYNKTVGQVVLRWVLSKGVLPLPKSTTKARISENLDVFDFYLLDKDIKAIDDMKGIFGSATDPDATDF